MILRILKLNYSNDYLRVNLSKNRIGTKFKIHRLVAETFLDNPKSLLVVGHKNDNKLDNHINNLYWTDHKENLTHNVIHLRRQKPIIAVNETTILFFKSETEAKYKGFKRQSIVSCLSKKQKRYKTYAWFRI